MAAERAHPQDVGHLRVSDGLVLPVPPQVPEMTYLRAPFGDAALRKPPCPCRKLNRCPLPACRYPPGGAGCIARLEVVQEGGMGESRPQSVQ